MPVELKVPKVGESIVEVEVGQWLKAPGEAVGRDEAVVMLESEKATVELPAPTAGTLTQVLKKTGEMAAVGEVIGYLEEGAVAPQEAQADAQPAAAKPSESAAKLSGEPVPEWDKPARDKSAKKGEPAAAQEKPASQPPARADEELPRLMPAARRALVQYGLRPEMIEGTGPGGRVLKEDVERTAHSATSQPATLEPEPTPDEEVVPMTFLRRKIAERLVAAQQTAALLTTFNEIDMSAVMALRKAHQEAFQKRYGIKVGFMSFFVKASIDALKQVPQVNAEIRGTDIVYRNHYDIGVAIGSGKGLVVPILRGADRMSFAEVEKAIADFAVRTKDGKLTPDELTGGTFTITNGGIYGSLLSTPIVNPPQSGILGMHSIQERPVARDGQVVIRPMMYVALTYDHRLVDGREAVTFLVRIKDCIENPARMLLEV